MGQEEFSRDCRNDWKSGGGDCRSDSNCIHSNWENVINHHCSNSSILVADPEFFNFFIKLAQIWCRG
ncbi:uncharacterized protein CELE_Y51A2A.16 [Caenorhabditis elegans]|uniref:Uncharacterized protein n=1 Tax=Caenorhabditis elegans TaxID=6239 RepID=F9UKU5_CAEEL|nr:Uncharacterized protein CELE_Y51A2A.16 [Caenorhabditis elegans]CCC42206.1 Uncharacterized protein CELE_Y51A2A.16 [Caenorhabditis elegans]|eukprot:NP_001256794.1 Uncharacterized protein CELE_Y51A2A.16 [Caenorhabditis elegans]